MTDREEHEKQTRQRVAAIVTSAINRSALTKAEIAQRLTRGKVKSGREYLRSMASGEHTPRIATLSRLLEITGHELVISMRKADPEEP